ncbi:MAG: hypothetical protein PUD20_01155 [bacterium]|nr:hypothetical protein [bacterium]
MRLMNKIKYRLHRYFLSSKPVFPILIIFAFIASIYSARPMEVNSGFIISVVFQFCLMIFVTESMNGSEITDEEQILFLHEKRVTGYLAVRELSMIFVSVIYSLIICLGPILVNCWNHFAFFRRELTFFDCAMGFVMVIGSGLCGIAIGDLFNPRIKTDRKIAIVSTIFILIITVAKEGILERVKYLEVLNILLPPVTEPLKQFSSCDVFDERTVMLIFAWMAIYYLVVTAIKFKLMDKKRF